MLLWAIVRVAGETKSKIAQGERPLFADCPVGPRGTRRAAAPSGLFRSVALATPLHCQPEGFSLPLCRPAHACHSFVLFSTIVVPPPAYHHAWPFLLSLAETPTSTCCRTPAAPRLASTSSPSSTTTTWTSSSSTSSPLPAVVS